MQKYLMALGQNSCDNPDFNKIALTPSLRVLIPFRVLHCELHHLELTDLATNPDS